MILSVEIPWLTVTTKKGAKFIVSVTDYAIKIETDQRVDELHWQVSDDLTLIAIGYSAEAVSLP